MANTKYTPTTSTTWVAAPSSTNIHLDNRRTCTKCKAKDAVIEDFYNWGDVKKLQRNICDKCYCKAMDKLYGLTNDIEAEEILYAEISTTK